MTLNNLHTLRMTHYFNCFDHDKNGYLEERDFQAIAENVAAWCQVLTESEAYSRIAQKFASMWQALCAEVDANGDGRITLNEFLQWRQALIELPREEFEQRSIKAIASFLFDLMDFDGSGTITQNEYMMLGTAYALAPREAAEAFRHLDIDGNGTITRDEFLAGVRGFCLSESREAPGNWMLGPVPGIHIDC